jgi:hypothetical protein
MYGIVNKSIEDLVVANFGREKWIVHEKSGIDVDFSSNEVYDDAITYQIATTLSEEMNMTLSQVLTFGEWWLCILHLRNIQA